MSDKELMVMAAKAAGIRIRIYHGMVVDPGTDCICVTPTGFQWNPLVNDGDALRLAVKLGLFLEIDRPNQRASALPPDDDQEFSRELFGYDPCAAMRRAIVRAAAAIGKAMP